MLCSVACGDMIILCYHTTDWAHDALLSVGLSISSNLPLKIDDFFCEQLTALYSHYKTPYYNCQTVVAQHPCEVLKIYCIIE